jgi:hypothetical protein
MEMVSVSYTNLINIFQPFSKEMQSCFLGLVWITFIDEDGKFVFTDV